MLTSLHTPLERELEGYFVIARPRIAGSKQSHSKEIVPPSDGIPPKAVTSSPTAPRNDNEYAIQITSAI